MPSTTERLRSWCLVALIIFLPLSAWIVSLSGSYLIGLVRDCLFVFFVLLSLINWRHCHRPIITTWLALIFTLLALISFFYRQDSIEQWLRGVRYLTEPLILFATIQLFPLVKPNRALWRAFALIITTVVIGAVIEFFAPSLLRSTLDATGRGYLGQIHLADSLTRLQSTLAGPNALGLFLIVTLLMMPIWHKTIPRLLMISVGVLGIATFLLTFSRSSYLGLVVGGIVLITMGRHIWGRLLRPLATAFIILFVLLGGLLTFQPQVIIRTTSNSMRFEQYQRVWEQRREIGFWGRSAGAAGLVSVDRLDGGPNYYTENTYLDAYESLGILGLLAYLGFWVLLIRAFLVSKSIQAICSLSTVTGLAIAGIFINHYTGQAAIWLTLLFAGIVLGQINDSGVTPFEPTI